MFRSGARGRSGLFPPFLLSGFLVLNSFFKSGSSWVHVIMYESMYVTARLKVLKFLGFEIDTERECGLGACGREKNPLRSQKKKNQGARLLFRNQRKKNVDSIPDLAGFPNPFAQKGFSFLQGTNTVKCGGAGD